MGSCPSYIIFWTFPEFRCFPRYRNSIQIFSHFSLSSLDASFTNQDSSLNAEILSILHLMHCQSIPIKSNLTFVLSVKRKTRVYPPGRRFFSASSSFGQTRVPFNGDATFSGRKFFYVKEGREWHHYNIIFLIIY